MPPSSQQQTSRQWLPAALIGAVVVIVALALLGIDYFRLGARPAPQLSFTDLKGRQVTLAQLRGKVVLVNFWATSCAICMHEMPQMVRTYEQFKSQGLEFIAVAMSYDRPDYVLNYAQSRQLPFTVALDLQHAAADAFGGIQGTPTTFLIGKDGTIVRSYLGEPDFDALQRLLKQELGT